MRFSPASARDLDALLDLERLCYPPAQAYGREEYRYALTVANAENLKVRDGAGRGAPAPPLVGFVGAFVHERRRTGNVYTVNVHPEARGRGLGRSLMEGIEARLAARGMARCVLEVNVENAPAIALYEAMGYERVKRLPRYYSSYANPDAWRYEKTLPAALAQKRSGSSRHRAPSRRTAPDACARSSG